MELVLESGLILTLTLSLSLTLTLTVECEGGWLCPQRWQLAPLVVTPQAQRNVGRVVRCFPPCLIRCVPPPGVRVPAERASTARAARYPPHGAARVRVDAERGQRRAMLVVMGHREGHRGWSRDSGGNAADDAHIDELGRDHLLAEAAREGTACGREVGTAYGDRVGRAASEATVRGLQLRDGRRLAGLVEGEGGRRGGIGVRVAMVHLGDAGEM